MDPRLRTPALRGDLAALNRALDEGADPNLADADGYNPLIFAAINNRVDCVARLIEVASRPDCHVTNEGLTPLNIAARYGYTYEPYTPPVDFPPTRARTGPGSPPSLAAAHASPPTSSRRSWNTGHT